MKTLLQTLFFFLLVTQICFGQWYQQNSGTNKNLHAVQFVDSNNGWTVGDSGLILHTNNGTYWIQQTSGVEHTLRDICFMNADTGWAVGGDMTGPESWQGIILKTTNGGTSWFLQINDSTFCLKAVYFIDVNTGWAVGEYNSVILKTTNGGINWLVQSAPTELPLNDVYFIDSTTGYIVGGIVPGEGAWGIVLKTTNGGVTWSEQTVQSASCWYGILFSDVQNGIIVGLHRYWIPFSGSIFLTMDSGANWVFSFENGFEYSAFNSIASIDSNYFWVVGWDYDAGSRIFFSSNRGIDWTSQVDSGLYSNSLNNICFINSTTGWAVGDNGTILHTTNGGVTFVEEEQIDGYPTEYNLTQNFPNPFNPSTKIKYSVPQSSQVVIKIFDILGNEIETLVNEEKSVGSYELTWNAKELPSGVYFCQLKAGEYVNTKKMILIK